MAKTDIEFIDIHHSDLVSISLEDIENESVNTDVNAAKAIVNALLKALLADLAELARKPAKYGICDLGWRNKYRIHLLSKVSQKRIYREIGIIEKLINCGLIVYRDSPTRWGKQKLQYRLDISSFLLKQDKIA